MQKCAFLQDTVKFGLGHQVSAVGVGTDEATISAMKNWEVPTHVKELQSLLGYCGYYCRFIRGFSQIAGPLHDLVNTHSGVKGKTKRCHGFGNEWTPDCQSSFVQLKEKLKETAKPVKLYQRKQCIALQGCSGPSSWGSVAVVSAWLFERTGS